MSQSKTLVLVDGSSYLFRAYYALPPLTNSQGQPTGAILGVINMLRRLMSEHAHDKFAVVFDAKGPNFRHKLYPEYKINRTQMPDELQQQIAPLHAVIKALGIPIIISDNVEADDVIATLVTEAKKRKWQVIVSTGDKDLAQLVDEHVTLINTMNNAVLDPSGVEAKFGVPPNRIHDYLSLVGDSSDNIPGIAKVGPKTAVKWLHEYGNLENIVKHRDEIKGKVGENLRNGLEQLRLSQELVALKYDVKLTTNLDELELGAGDRNALLELLKDLEFKALLKEYQQAAAAKVAIKIIAINSATQFKAFREKLQQGLKYSCDVSVQDDVLHCAFCVDDVVYQIIVDDKNQQELQQIFSNKKLHKIMHGSKNNAHILAKFGIILSFANLDDTMLESYILYSTKAHDLASSISNYLGEENIDDSAKRAYYMWRLHDELHNQLQENPQLKKLYQSIELPLASVLCDMEQTGILLDVDLLQQQAQDLNQHITTLQAEIFSIADDKFNLDSPKQLQEILYTKLKLPILKKTPKGQPSTKEDVLQELAYDFPIAKLLLTYRTLSKLKSTYVDKLPLQVNAGTGRLHTTFHQVVTATGRLSSSDPNLQNIPIRVEEGRKIRQAFVAKDGCKLISADYSQIELRIMAHLSHDPGLCTAFQDDLDIHKATAAEIFGVELGKVTQEQRRFAKVINFGLIYGMSAYGFARNLNIDKNSAQIYIDKYFARYPKVYDYMEQTRQFAMKHGFVETILGRRLYLQDVNSNNKMLQQRALRAAINAPMQGSAADLIKIAMLEIEKLIIEKQYQSKMLLQVHDELLFEVPENELAVFAQDVTTIMEGCMELSVPLKISQGIGANWDDAH